MPAARQPGLGASGSTATTRRRRRSSRPTRRSSPATCSRSCRRCRDFDADALRTATSDTPPDDIFLELPDDLPPVDRRRRRRRSPPAPRPTYDKMLALQNWFRTNFTYDTERAARQQHDRHRVVPAIRKAATASSSPATFAAMARTLGIPARVAVGFTPGELRADGTLRACSAATPTPGRRSGSTASAGSASSRPRVAAMPGAEAYTGVAAATGRPSPTRTATRRDHDHRRPTTTCSPATTLAHAGRRRRPRRPTHDAAGPPTTGDDRRRRFAVAARARRSSSWWRCSPALPALARRWRPASPRSASDPAAPARRRRGSTRCSAVGAAGVRADPALTPLEQSTPPWRERSRASPAPLDELADGGHGGHVRDERRGSRLADDSEPS